MKKILFVFVLTLLVHLQSGAQSLTSVLLPQYIQGNTGTNSNRIPFAYRARLTGLTSNATYRYYNQVIISTDAATQSGAGNCIFKSVTGNFIRTTGPGLKNAGTYDSLTTDGTGTYEGWFITEPTGNARFIPGKYVYMRITLNDGAGGSSAVTRITTADSVRVVKLDPASSDSTGTALRCTSSGNPKDFIFTYDNTTGTGRPISGSFIESDGTANTIANSFASFYSNSVDGVNGAFGVVLPNILPNGIQRIERWSLTTGAIIDNAKDDDGIWPSGANTINPSGGSTTEIVLTSADAALPVELTSFTVVSQKMSAQLKWNTATEVNNYGFEIERRAISDQPSGISNWQKIGFVAGAGTSNSSHDYSFNDNTVTAGSFAYRLKQIDNNGSYKYSQEAQVRIVGPNIFSLNQNYPNPFNPSTTIEFTTPTDGKATLKVFDLLGRQIATLFDGMTTSGEIHRSAFDASSFPSGVYFARLDFGGRQLWKRMVLMK